MSSFLSSVIDSIGNEEAYIASESEREQRYIDTGSYALNALISGSIFGGLPADRVTTFAGQSSTGKTFYILGLCKHFLETNKDGSVIYFESEGAVDTSLLRKHGIDTNRVLIVGVTTIQQFKTQAIRVLEEYEKLGGKKSKRPPLLVCLDSLGMLSTTKEVEDTMEGKEVRDMSRSGHIRAAFRVLSQRLYRLEVPFILTNHTYDAVGQMYGPSQVQSGGKGVVYASSTIVFLSKSKDKDGTEQVGNIIKCKLEKSRFTKEQSMVETKISFKNGLDRYFGLMSLAIEAGVWSEGAGGRIVLPDGSKVFQKTINSNPSDYYTEEVLKAIDTYCATKFQYGNSEVEEEVENELE